MEALLAKYGYSLLFFGVMAEGEAFLLGASVLAHRGLLRLPLVIMVAVAANSVIDQVYYVLARGRGWAWLEKRYGSHPRYARLTRLMERHGAWLLLASRFAFGFRILIPAACGALAMSARVFVPVNLLAGVISPVPTALLGYYGGRALEGLLADVQHHEILIAPPWWASRPWSSRPASCAGSFRHGTCARATSTPWCPSTSGSWAV